MAVGSWGRDRSQWVRGPGGSHLDRLLLAAVRSTGLTNDTIFASFGGGLLIKCLRYMSLDFEMNPI